tara:strand:+ start:683 stop:835 length:153 start_codon:yes stop_codon:yes gene_type:complete
MLQVFMVTLLTHQWMQLYKEKLRGQLYQLTHRFERTEEQPQHPPTIHTMV